MKKTGFLISCLMLTAGLPILGGIPTAQASNFLGVFCWNLSVGYESGTLKLAVTDMGQAHFIVNGTMGDDEGLDAAHGNAEIVNNAVLLNLNSTGMDQNGIWSSSFAATLDPSTLSGSFKIISQDYYNGNMEPLNYQEGTLTFTACP